MTRWLDHLRWRIRTEWNLYQRKRARKIRSRAVKNGINQAIHNAAVRHGVAL